MQNGKNNGSDLVAKNAIALNPTKRNHGMDDKEHYGLKKIMSIEK